MKMYSVLIFAIAISVFLIGCFDDFEVSVPGDVRVESESGNTAEYDEIDGSEFDQDDHDEWIQYLLYDNVFKKLYKKAAGKVVLSLSNPFGYSINGADGGNAQIQKILYRNATDSFTYFDQKYLVTYNNYKKDGYIINGSYSFYTGKRYEYISNPPTANFIYEGGSEGGSLEISGKISTTVSVTVSVLNMLDNYKYHYNETLLTKYRISGIEYMKEMPMLAPLYRKTFRDAYMELIYKPVDGTNWTLLRDGESVTIDGPDGGSAAKSCRKEQTSGNTTSYESYTFTNYRSNGLLLNGKIVMRYVENSSGEIIEGCNDNYFINVSGLYEASVQHTAVIHKPASIWNFRMGYFVDSFYFESVGVRISVGVGVN